MRSTVGGIATLAALLLVRSALVGSRPTSAIKNDFSLYLVGNAANSMFSLHQSAGTLSPWAGFGVVAASTAAAVAATASG